MWFSNQILYICYHVLLFLDEKGVPDMARSPNLVVTANHVDFGTLDGDGNYYVTCNDPRFDLKYSRELLFLIIY